MWFITEVAGIPEMGQIGRGENNWNSYLGRTLSEYKVISIYVLLGHYSNRITQAMGVGLDKFNDVMDALGSDYWPKEKHYAFKRNDVHKWEWLSNKSQDIPQGWTTSKIRYTYIRDNNGRLKSWQL